MPEAMPGESTEIRVPRGYADSILISIQGGKGNVDRVFWERIKKLLKIAIPSWKTKEVLYIIVLSCLLVVRTYLSIWLADVNGQIVKSIVRLNFQMFMRRVFALMLFAIPSSTVNSGMDYFTKLLATAFRERLTGYFH